MLKQTKILSVSLPQKAEKRLERFAEKRGKSRSAIVGEALRYYFLRQEFDLLSHDLSRRWKAVHKDQAGKKKWSGFSTWKEILAKLNHLASQGSKNVNLANFIHHDRQAH